MDLFASHLNAKTESFCAWQPDPKATHIDAFQIEWETNNYYYAFPPFSLVAAVLQKVLFDVSEMVLIVPFWPTQAWHPRLGRMLTEQPRMIEMRGDTLRLPHDSQARHPLIGTMRLMACRISGEPSSAADFRTMWQQRCSTRVDHHHAGNMRYTSDAGKHFVVDGMKIPVGLL